MHCNTHGTAGIAIITTCYLLTKSTKKACALGGTIAFLSHYILDFIGESGYKTMQELLLVECIILLYSMVVMYKSGFKFLLLAIYGYITANLMDLVDKKMYLAILFPKNYSLTYYFHSKNQVLFPISYEATMAAALFSLVLVLICYLSIKYSQKLRIN